jgi:hypothetical protein
MTTRTGHLSEKSIIQKWQLQWIRSYFRDKFYRTIPFDEIWPWATLNPNDIKHIIIVRETNHFTFVSRSCFVQSHIVDICDVRIIVVCRLPETFLVLEVCNSWVEMNSDDNHGQNMATCGILCLKSRYLEQLASWFVHCWTRWFYETISPSLWRRMFL